MFSITTYVSAYKHIINTNTSHNALNIHIIANFVANYINTNTSLCMENAIQNGKTRAVLPRHPQGGHQQLGLQGHDYRAPICFSSVITWHDHRYATSKI